MNRMVRRASILTWAVAGGLLLTAGRASAAPLEQTEKKGSAIARAQLDRDALELSEEIVLTVNVEGPVPLEVEAINTITQSKAWLVVSAGKPVTAALPKGRMRWQQSFRLSPLGDKELSLPLVPLRCRAGNDDPATISWKPFTVKVNTVVTAPSLSALRPIEPPEQIPQPPAFPWWLLTTGVGILVVGIGATLTVRRWRRRPEPAAVDLPPEEWALQELERLEALAPTAVGQVERYHTWLADVVRRYLERRFGLHTFEQTTREFLTALEQSAQLPAEQQAQLRAFFERCDLAKYARADYSADECRTAVCLAREFVSQSVATQTGQATGLSNGQLAAKK
jgi:hypothetical protein